MDGKENGIYKRYETDQDFSLDIEISELLELPEFRLWPNRLKNGRSTRVFTMLHSAKEMGMETLEDLKDYIEEHGWKRKSYSNTTRFRRFGEKSIEYFNATLKKYGIEPLGPLYISK